MSWTTVLGCTWRMEVGVRGGNFFGGDEGSSFEAVEGGGEGWEGRAHQSVYQRNWGSCYFYCWHLHPCFYLFFLSLFLPFLLFFVSVLLLVVVVVVVLGSVPGFCVGSREIIMEFSNVALLINAQILG